MNWEVADANSILRWRALSNEFRESLSGKISDLWGAPSDAEAFDSLSIDKQQALLLIVSRMEEKKLWHLVRKIDNVYGEGGVGIGFQAWPALKSTLQRRSDFTRWLANHKDTNGGYYEKRQPGAVLHFLYVNGSPLQWYVHFDLHSPIYSPRSAFRHLRHEFLGGLTPDWRMIKAMLIK